MKNYIMVSLMALLLTGCATTQFHVNVNSINNNEPIASKKCVIFPALKDITVDDLQFKEYATYAIRALEWKGYTITDKADDADIAIFLGYGIGEPTKHQYSYAMPIWGQTGVSSSTTTGITNIHGNAYSYGGNTNLYGSGTTSSTTTYTPQYGIVGAVPQVGSFVTYDRFVFLTAYDLKLFRETQKEKQIWKTEITSRGSSGDLRRIFPIMLAGAAPYLGENTGQYKQFILTEEGKGVLKIKGITKGKK